MTAPVASPLEAAVTGSPNLRPRTRELYLAGVRRFVLYAGHPARWTLAVAEDWLASLVRDGLAPQTANVYRKALRHASRRRAHREPGAADFAAGLEAMRAPPQKHKRVLEEREVAALLRACRGGELEDARDHALIVVALRTGLRRAALASLKIENIDPPWVTAARKGGGVLTFEADGETLAAIDDWLSEIGDPKVGPVFRRIARGRALPEAMSDFQVWDVFRRRARQAGIRHVHPHLARHTTVTWLRESGVPPERVAQLTGQTEKTIEDIYTHLRRGGPVGAALPPLGRR